jgi:hypothetical protein
LEETSVIPPFLALSYIEWKCSFLTQKIFIEKHPISLVLAGRRFKTGRTPLAHGFEAFPHSSVTASAQSREKRFPMSIAPFPSESLAATGALSLPKFAYLFPGIV